MNIFGVWRFCGYFGGSLQNWTGFMSHFYALYAVFLRSKYRMRIFLWVAKLIFLGVCLKFQNSKIMIKPLEHGMQVNWYCCCCVLGRSGL